jgi:hypothetical protein
MVPVSYAGYRIHQLVTDGVGCIPRVEEHHVVEHDASLDDGLVVVQHPGHAHEGRRCHQADDDRPEVGSRLQVLAGALRHAAIDQLPGRLRQRAVELVDHALDNSIPPRRGVVQDAH